MCDGPLKNSGLSQLLDAPAMSTDIEFQQALDDIDIFIAPLALLSDLMEKAPDERSKGFVFGVLAFRTQLSILTGMGH